MEVDGVVGALHGGRIFYSDNEVSALMELHTLASGSSGNAALLSRDGTHILLDAGISCRRITTALRQLGLTPEDLTGIFITHCHADHISGLSTIVKHWDVPIYASGETCRQMDYRIAGIGRRLCPLAVGETVSVGYMTVTAFSTAHDAPGACGYRVDSAGFLTDTGYVTDAAAETLSGVPLLVLEANHDIETLRCGPYPYYLKQRILGDWGHLSNEAAADFARRCAENGTREIVLAHLSRENNTPVMAYDAVARALAALDTPPELSVAPRDELSRCYRTEEMPCRK